MSNIKPGWNDNKFILWNLDDKSAVKSIYEALKSYEHTYIYIDNSQIKKCF